MGDVFAATLLGRLVDGKTLPQALELATATLYSLVKATTPGSRDLPLIAEQMQLVEPAAHFAAQAIAP
ncbi:pyridoxamine kinase [compost metagenome]